MIGHAGHPEVEGTMGRIPGPIHLVQSEADLENIDLAADTPIASQTTLSVDETRSIIAALKRRFPNIVGPEAKDICYATQNRQSAVRELSKLASCWWSAPRTVRTQQGCAKSAPKRTSQPF